MALEEKKKVLADKAYSCDSIRTYLEERGAVVFIPDKANFKVKYRFVVALLFASTN